MKEQDKTETNGQSLQKRIAQKFLSDPLTKYHCGYNLVSPLSKDSIYHSIKTSLLPEFKSEVEKKSISHIIKLIVEYQNVVNRILNNTPALRNFISQSSPKSEANIYCLDRDEYIYSIQRIDYLLDINNNIKIIDPNIIPLGLGLFFLRDDMMCNYFDSIKSVYCIDNSIRKEGKFKLEVIARMLNNWQKKFPVKGSKTIHLITEKCYNNNLDHKLVCNELRKYNIDIKISYLQDLQFNTTINRLVNMSTNENINYVWRYGRFPVKEKMNENWKELYQAIKSNSIEIINKPGIYSLENKIFLALFFVDGFQELLEKNVISKRLFELKQFLPFNYLLKIDRKNNQVNFASFIDDTGVIKWSLFDLNNLPRSYVFKTPDTSGSKGVRLVINESNRKCQKYFWEFVELFPEQDIFIISELVRTNNVTIIDPSNNELLPETFIPKNHVFFVSSANKTNLIGFSAFARKNNYKVHGAQDTVAIVQYY